ncbi:hypothetical protein HK105_202517 [Polyrhizophydium stewartii]|uniref:SPIN90/Ldb17 leucine-rich domain-containing protein n=1 Tax=Polyrhizophydium stewartii TaxID=2732419 RepID=A0ABR4NEZ5_9FUNG
MPPSTSSAVEHLEALLQDVEAFRSLDGADTARLIVERIVRDVPYVRDDEDMRIIAEHVLDFAVFEDMSEALAFLAQAAADEDKPTLLVRMSLLLHFGLATPNVFRRLAQDDWIPLLRDVVLRVDDDKVLHIAVILFEQLCQVYEMSLSELDLIDSALIERLLDLVEASRDLDESYNYALLKLLICFNDQLLKKRGSLSMRNKLVQILAKRANNCKTFSENLIFIFNRADKPELQLSIVHLLTCIFQFPDTQYLFYTNDLTVIIDIAVRETQRVSDADEQLQHALLILMQLVVGAGASDRSAAQVKALLSWLSASPLSKGSTKRLAARILTEINSAGTPTSATSVASAPL